MDESLKNGWVGSMAAGLVGLPLLAYLASKEWDVEKKNRPRPANAKAWRDLMSKLPSGTDPPAGSAVERAYEYTARDLAAALEREEHFSELLRLAIDDLEIAEGQNRLLTDSVEKMTHQIHGQQQVLVDLQAQVASLKAEQEQPPGPAPRKRKRRKR